MPWYDHGRSVTTYTVSRWVCDDFRKIWKVFGNCLGESTCSGPRFREDPCKDLPPFGESRGNFPSGVVSRGTSAAKGPDGLTPGSPGLRFQRSKAAVTPDLLRNYLHQILSAIAYCHGHNVVHRDMKLENCLLKERSARSLVKIIDFGLASLLAVTGQRMHDVLGTPYYIAPEIIDKSGRVGRDVCGDEMWLFGMISFPQFLINVVVRMVGISAAGRG